MAEYENAAEEALLVDSEMVEEAAGAELATSTGHFHTYISYYITAISLVVAIAALVTALAADECMDEMLGGLVELVESNGMRVEMRCSQIQQELAALTGKEATAPVKPLITDAAHKLARFEQESRSLRYEAATKNRAHYVLAVGITLLQVATGLAATVSLTKKRNLLYPSALFACGGVSLTLAGVAQFLASGA
mgnify:CR=1 FL=1